MSTFPAITHVAVTVTDLAVSVPWYRQLFDAEPVLDEDTGPFRHVVFAVGLDELGITHGGIVAAHYGSGLSVKDPDAVALEFFAPPA